MTQTLFKEKFPLNTITIEKKYTIDEILLFYKQKIETHPVATFITIFDHYAHTREKADHQIADDIVNVKNIIFCFGKEIPNPLVAAVRPRSIAVVETKESFVISFMDAPKDDLTKVMREWTKEL